MSLWRFSSAFSAADPEFRISLGEGQTPLLPSRRIGIEAGFPELWFKLENLNPSGSYKDRFAAAAVSLLAQKGKAGCLCTSSGNSGSALAAYCAAAGLPCIVLVVENPAADKIAQISAYGAKILEVSGFGKDPEVTEEIMEKLLPLAEGLNLGREISAFRYSPEGMSAVATISLEILQQHKAEKRQVFVPAGGGGLTLAVARGFEGVEGTAVHCVQPEGNNTIAGPLQEGLDEGRPCHSTTELSGLQVGPVIDGNETLSACRRTGGTGYTVSDEEAWEAQKLLACKEGIFCEPAGAVALAGFLKAVREKKLACEDPAICLVTGSGFKDMRQWTVSREAELRRVPVTELDDACAHLLASWSR